MKKVFKVLDFICELEHPSNGYFLWVLPQHISGCITIAKLLNVPVSCDGPFSYIHWKIFFTKYKFGKVIYEGKFFPIFASKKDLLQFIDLINQQSSNSFINLKNYV